MKKTSVFILLLLSLVNLFSFWYFKLLQYQIKTEVKQTIKEGVHVNALTAVDASNKDIKWIEANKEFYLNFHMYDIVYKEDKENKTIFYCIDDSKEKQLIESFTRTNKDHKNSLKIIVKLISMQYVPMSYTFYGKLTVNKVIFIIPCKFYSSVYDDLDTPPPQA